MATSTSSKDIPQNQDGRNNDQDQKLTYEMIVKKGSHVIGKHADELHIQNETEKTTKTLEVEIEIAEKSTSAKIRFKKEDFEGGVIEQNDKPQGKTKEDRGISVFICFIYPVCNDAIIT